jgi:hypothetical protein
MGMAEVAPHRYMASVASLHTAVTRHMAPVVAAPAFHMVVAAEVAMRT